LTICDAEKTPLIANLFPAQVFSALIAIPALLSREFARASLGNLR
jgi:hypothetical protein